MTVEGGYLKDLEAKTLASCNDLPVEEIRGMSAVFRHCAAELKL
jgi:hypothetical protein